MKLSAVVVSVLLLGSSSLSAGNPDLKKIDRSLVKEPKYKEKPYYALLVIGPKAEKRIWLVVDGEILYVDRNGNGDLTETKERVAIDEKEKEVLWLSLSEMYKGRNHFDMGEVAGLRLRLDFLVRDKKFVPETERDKQRLEAHTQFAGEGGEIAILSRDNSPAPIHVTFCKQPKDAHICHIAGPLTFALRSKDATLERGSDRNLLQVIIGTPGLPVRGVAGPVLAPLGITEVPADVHPVALLEFPHRDARRPPVKLQVVLDQRC
jgi:hypothetical protein